MEIQLFTFNVLPRSYMRFVTNSIFFFFFLIYMTFYDDKLINWRSLVHMLCEATYNLMDPNNYLACPYLFFWSLIHTSHLSLSLWTLEFSSPILPLP
jgi:hypothetical protein